jgi:hypothetical protein
MSVQQHTFYTVSFDFIFHTLRRNVLRRRVLEPLISQNKTAPHRGRTCTTFSRGYIPRRMVVIDCEKIFERKIKKMCCLKYEGKFPNAKPRGERQANKLWSERTSEDVMCICCICHMAAIYHSWEKELFSTKIDPLQHAEWSYLKIYLLVKSRRNRQKKWR